MMRILYLFCLMGMLLGCSTPKIVAKPSKSTKTNKSDRSLSPETLRLIETAKSYLGTPYRYGGTTRSGIDCSGLVLNSFSEIGIQVPRISRDQANSGSEVSLNKVRPGDVLFFNTSGSGISHAGIVERIENGEVFFIHSSSSSGVIISSLNNSYWQPRFVTARRLL